MPPQKIVGEGSVGEGEGDGNKGKGEKGGRTKFIFCVLCVDLYVFA